MRRAHFIAVASYFEGDHVPADRAGFLEAVAVMGRDRDQEASLTREIEPHNRTIGIADHGYSSNHLPVHIKRSVAHVQRHIGEGEIARRSGLLYALFVLILAGSPDVIHYFLLSIVAGQ